MASLKHSARGSGYPSDPVTRASNGPSNAKNPFRTVRAPAGAPLKTCANRACSVHEYRCGAPLLGLSIPLYDEVDVEAVVNDIVVALESEGIQFVLALVDNGSQDDPRSV